jgi:hypothetical protein
LLGGGTTWWCWWWYSPLLVSSLTATRPSTTRPSSSSAMAAMCSRLRPALLSLTLCIVLEDGNLELCISIFLLASSCCWRPRVASF